MQTRSPTRCRVRLSGEVPGAAVDPGLVTTDAEGRAEAVVRLGSETGEHLIIARVVGAASPDLSARFSVVATSSGGGGGGKKDDEGKGHNGGHDDDD